MPLAILRVTGLYLICQAEAFTLWNNGKCKVRSSFWAHRTPQEVSGLIHQCSLAAAFFPALLRNCAFSDIPFLCILSSFRLFFYFCEIEVSTSNLINCTDRLSKEACIFSQTTNSVKIERSIENVDSSIDLRMPVLWRGSSLFALYILVAAVSP